MVKFILARKGIIVLNLTIRKYINFDRKEG